MTFQNALCRPSYNQSEALIEGEMKTRHGLQMTSFYSMLHYN